MENLDLRFGKTSFAPLPPQMKTSHGKLRHQICVIATIFYRSFSCEAFFGAQMTSSDEVLCHSSASS